MKKEKLQHANPNSAADERNQSSNVSTKCANAQHYSAVNTAQCISNGTLDLTCQAEEARQVTSLISDHSVQKEKKLHIQRMESTGSSIKDAIETDLGKRKAYEEWRENMLRKKRAKQQSEQVADS